MQGKVCMFTGHRIIPGDACKPLWEELKKELSNLYVAGVRDFITGGALGFDTLAALTVLTLRDIRPDVKLHLYLPCRDQDKKWNAKDKERFSHILERADDVIYICDKYVPGCMHTRNRRMVDNSDICVAYLRRDSGGTAYTVDYAQGRGLKIIRV